MPGDGVYAGRCGDHVAAISVGNAPTFENAEWQVEAHLLDFSGDLYGKTVRLELIDWIREQRKFRGIEELKKQIARDIEDCRFRARIDPSRMLASVA
jgi:riboflavin kinase/FMN adenylyltransferase